LYLSKNKQNEVVNKNSKNLNCEIDVLGMRQETSGIKGKALDRGKKVEVNIKPIYSGSSKRPDSFEVSYLVDGKQFERIMKNTPTGD